jgi:hypothetical protein
MSRTDYRPEGMTDYVDYLKFVETLGEPYCSLLGEKEISEEMEPSRIKRFAMVYFIQCDKTPDPEKVKYIVDNVTDETSVKRCVEVLNEITGENFDFLIREAECGESSV